MLQLIKNNKTLAEIDENRMFFSTELITANDAVNARTLLEALQEIESQGKAAKPGSSDTPQRLGK